MKTVGSALLDSDYRVCLLIATNGSVCVTARCCWRSQIDSPGASYSALSLRNYRVGCWPSRHIGTSDCAVFRMVVGEVNLRRTNAYRTSSTDVHVLFSFAKFDPDYPMDSAQSSSISTGLGSARPREDYPNLEISVPSQQSTLPGAPF